MNWSMYLTQVKCLYLPWESASESQLQDIMPDVVWEFNWSFYSITELNFSYCFFKFVQNSNVIHSLVYYYFSLGADVIYDPVCLPHLVRVLSILLNQMNSSFCRQHASCKSLSTNIKLGNGEQNHEDATDICNGRCKAISKEAPVAYIAYVIRNIETFNCFLTLGKQANLDIVDLTDSLKPLNLLCYMQSYNQASVKLLRITCSNTQ